MYKIGLVKRSHNKWDAYAFHTNDDFMNENVLFKETGKSIRKALKAIHKHIPREKVDFTYLVPNRRTDG